MRLFGISLTVERGRTLIAGETVSRRSSWIVMRRRLWVFRTSIGYVNARNRQEALERAAARWPGLAIDVYVNHRTPRAVSRLDKS